jgi:Domain of unknown function (DUF4136)
MSSKFTVLRRMCTLLPAIGLLTGMAAACSDDDDIVGVIPTPIVRSVRNPAFNFTTLRTFAMPDTVAHFNTLAGSSSDLSRAFDRTVLDQVRANLIARGYVQVVNPQTVQPDFVVLIGANAASQAIAYQTYSFYPYYGYYSGWGWYAPGLTSDYLLVYPFYSSTDVVTFDRGTFIVTIVPTLTVNPLAKSFNAEWAGSATSLLSSSVTVDAALVRGAVDEMFAQSPYLVAGP